VRAKFVGLTAAWFGGLAALTYALAGDLLHVPQRAALLVSLVALVALGVVATRVGYRWFDALFALIPIYGVCFQIKLLWRLAALPGRYWERLGSTRARSSSPLEPGWHPVPWEPRFFRYWDGRKWGRQIVPADQLGYGPRPNA
jgi:hypothetical protein